MVYDPKVKEFAYTLDPEAWKSYSGQAKHIKQGMERRRKSTITRAQACFDGYGDIDDRLMFVLWKSVYGVNTVGIEIREVFAEQLYLVSVCFVHELRPELGLRHNPKKQYLYLTNRQDIEVGDIVVVDSPTTSYTCVKVVGIQPYKGVHLNYKWVVTRVDDTEYLQHQQMLQEQIKRKRERQATINALQKTATKLSKDLEELVENHLRNLARHDVVNMLPEGRAIHEALQQVQQQLAALQR